MYLASESKDRQPAVGLALGFRVAGRRGLVVLVFLASVHKDPGVSEYLEVGHKDLAALAFRAFEHMDPVALECLVAERTDPVALAFQVVGHMDLAALEYWVVARKDPVVLVYQAFGRMDPAAEPAPHIGPVGGACRGAGRRDPDSASE